MMAEKKMDKSQAWDYALGMIRFDGLEPTKDFLAMVEKEKLGIITKDDIKKALDAKYHMKKDNDGISV